MRRFMVLETYPTTRGGRPYTKKKMGMMREGVKEVVEWHNEFYSRGRVLLFSVPL